MSPLRTAIYLAEPSTVTIRPLAPSQTKATLYRFRGGAGKPAFGSHALDPGIYMVLADAMIDVTATGSGATIAPLSKDKDKPPEPKAMLTAEPGATLDELYTFFLVAKDGDPAQVPPEDGPDFDEQDGDDVEDE
jgi:hypothetical protein